MRAYTESSEENLRAGRLLKEWAGDGLIDKEQRQRLEQDTASGLRTTNIFLRLVLFLFTLIGVGAAIALFFTIFLSRPSEQTSGLLSLIFAVVAYIAAEMAVAQARLYRYGIEEAFAVCSVGFLCAGLDLFFFSGVLHASREMECVVPAIGALAALWIWYRFNLWYAFPAAMIFAVFLPGFWTTSHTAQHLFIAALYAAGLIGIAPVRARHRFDYLAVAYSLAEAFLWLGLYVTFNLQLSDLNMLSFLGLPRRFIAAPAGPFYWTTWVLIWCLPPLILARGIRGKDRLVLAAGAITAVLTLVTNKPYLGWQRHTWDPMLLGVVLTGVSLFLRRWLAQGPDGIRHGFTAARLSGKDKQVMSAGSAVLGLVTPQSITPAAQPGHAEVHFGGGGSGGGGASRDF